MAVTISTSSSSEDVWMAQNAVFSTFASLVTTRFSDDEEVVSQVELAEAMNGVSLDVLYEEDSELAIRLRRAFQTVAKDVEQGKNWPSGEASNEIQTLFAKLIKLLERFHPEEKGTTTTTGFCESLVRHCPDLKELLAEHISDYDELLPNVFLGDVTRYVLADGTVSYQRFAKPRCRRSPLFFRMKSLKQLDQFGEQGLNLITCFA